MYGKFVYLCGANDQLTAMPIVSYIIPVYNVGPYLRECVDSCLGQNGNHDYEIVLVDDGSTDDSGAICDEYASSHDNVKVVHQPNAGLPAARNKGLSVATGQRVLFVDSDDFVSPDQLSVCLGAVNRYGDVDMVQFAYEYVKHTGESMGKVKGAKCNNLYTDITRYGNDGNYKPVSVGYLINRSLLDGHDLRFDETLRATEDAHFTLRYLFYCKRIVTISDVLYYYRQRPGSIMNQRVNYRVPYHHLKVAELLMAFFHDQSSGGDYPRFFKKQTTQLVVSFLKKLYKFEGNDKRRAYADYAKFKQYAKNYPGSLVGGFNMGVAKLNISLYRRMRRFFHGKL